jgi:hypothetical protein
MISQTQKFLLSHLRAVIVSTEDCYIRKMVVLLLAVDLTMVVVSPFFLFTRFRVCKSWMFLVTELNRSGYDLSDLHIS